MYNNQSIVENYEEVEPWEEHMLVLVPSKFLFHSQIKESKENCKLNCL
jgi:hypothetical protein